MLHRRLAAARRSRSAASRRRRRSGTRSARARARRPRRRHRRDQRDVLLRRRRSSGSRAASTRRTGRQLGAPSTRSTSFSRLRRYAIRSATVIIFRRWRWRTGVEVGHARHRAVVVHDLADHAGRLQPASLRGRPPPRSGRRARARRRFARASGNTWPGIDEVAPVERVGSIAAWIVRARGRAPRCRWSTPCAASTETVKAVPERRLVLWPTISEPELVAALPASSARRSARGRAWP